MFTSEAYQTCWAEGNAERSIKMITWTIFSGLFQVHSVLLFWAPPITSLNGQNIPKLSSYINLNSHINRNSNIEPFYCGLSNKTLSGWGLKPFKLFHKDRPRCTGGLGQTPCLPAALSRGGGQEPCRLTLWWDLLGGCDDRFTLTSSVVRPPGSGHQHTSLTYLSMRCHCTESAPCFLLQRHHGNTDSTPPYPHSLAPTFPPKQFWWGIPLSWNKALIHDNFSSCQHVGAGLSSNACLMLSCLPGWITLM